MTAAGVRSIALKVAAGLLTAALVLGAGVVARGNTGGTQADDFTVTGTVGPQPEDAHVAIDDGKEVYDLVTPIDPVPFFGRTVTIRGTLAGGILYGRQLTMGSIDIQVRGTAAHLITSGVVEQTADGYELTAEGITFTLTKSDQLNEVEGQKVDVEGDLTDGTVIMLTSVTTADGKEIETEPFGNEISDIPDSGTDLDSTAEDDG